MSIENNSESSTSTAASKAQGNKKTAFIVSAVASAIVIALSIVLISTSWTSYGEAKTELASAEDNLSSANATLSVANGYYDDASSAYYSWLSCYISTSWLYDWMCGSEASYSSDLDYAESLVAAAEADLKQARSRVDSANSDLDDAAAQFNQSVWIWGALSVIALAAFATFGTMQLKRNKVQRKTEELEARPDWDCPECSTHNEGGMFCIGCGFSKSDIKPGQEANPVEKSDPEQTSDETTEPEPEVKKPKAKPKAKQEPKE